GATRTTTTYTGKKTPTAARTAPAGPATRYPMNATVITTGPGVIIDTATASMNWRSVSQWNCWTTPPYRNVTIASPLPNTNRPAPAKYSRIFHSTPTEAGPPSAVRSRGPVDRKATAGAATAVRRSCTTTGTSPHNRNTQMISDSVQAVTRALTVNRSQRSLSRPSVMRTSFRTLRAMMAMTEAPIP